MMTFFCLLVLFVVVVSLNLAVQHWVFKRPGESTNTEWELYQQRYD